MQGFYLHMRVHSQKIDLYHTKIKLFYKIVE